MSDSAAPLAESGSAAPRSSTDIAASVISDAEHAETAAPETTRIDTTNLIEETPSPQPKTEPTEKELSAAAKFLLTQGHQAKKVDGRDVWLPYGTVEKMLDRYVGEHRTTWDGERTTLSTKAQKAEELQGYIDQLRAGVGGDPKAFLSELAEIDSRYAAFLEQKIAEVPVSEQMPQPDITLSDGSKTYSLKGLQDLLEWNTKRVEGTLDARLKPFQDRAEQDQQRAKQTQQAEAIHARTSQQLEDAATWTGWAEHKDDILKALQADSAEAEKAGGTPKLSLEGAYRKVVMAKLLEDDGKKRERLLKEIHDAPKSSALSRQTTDAPKTTGPRSTQDIVRATIAKLESQA